VVTDPYFLIRWNINIENRKNGKKKKNKKNEIDEALKDKGMLL
jgi:hypothetical protein